ncbi:hypothetical protein [Phenylobacterium sp.]|uniref:hypothetical protein n=1 Tax=Phenylobacterium sp. TaxID=1871053 RepID=UPI0030026A92
MTVFETEDENQNEAVATVAGAVLASFFDALEKADGLSDVAARLRKVVMEDGVMAEPAIRQALFPNDET